MTLLRPTLATVAGAWGFVSDVAVSDVKTFCSSDSGVSVLLNKQYWAEGGSSLPLRGKDCCVVLNYPLVMMLLNPVPKRLVIKKKISICGSGRALLKLHGWRVWGCSRQGRFRGLGWGGVGRVDQWVSDVMADSFRGKLQGLTSLVPGMPLFWFNLLDRHSSNKLLSTIIAEHTWLWRYFTSSHAESTSSALCPLAAFLAPWGESRAA